MLVKTCYTHKYTYTNTYIVFVHKISYEELHGGMVDKYEKGNL